MKIPYFGRHVHHFLSRCIAPVKILSKKEQKRLEDEEFDRLMNEVGTTEAQPAAQEETKQSAAAETQAEIDEKKRLANQKKKAKRKAKAAAAAENQPAEEQKELTEEER